MSCDGTVIGCPDAGDKRLFEASIKRSLQFAPPQKAEVNRHLVAVKVALKAAASVVFDCFTSTRTAQTLNSEL